MTAREFRFLSLNNVLRLHEDTLTHEGGSSGIRDMELLKSAIEMPQATYDGVLLHTGLARMAAAYLFHICQNHAFVDGNKRAAALSALVFLKVNGVEPEQLPPPEVLEKATTDVASGRMGKQELAHMFAEYLGGVNKEL